MMAKRPAVSMPMSGGTSSAGQDDQHQEAAFDFAAPVAHMVHPNDATLREIETQMGDNAALLKYLPIELVRIDAASNQKQPTTALPYHMHFGHIKNGLHNATYIRIILCVGALKGPPEQRYRKFSRLGELEGYLSAHDAARDAIPASAFRGIKRNGGMDPAQLRAVVRYYFIAKKLDIPVIWPVDVHFIKDLVAACRLAKAHYEKKRGLDGMEMPPPDGSVIDEGLYSLGRQIPPSSSPGKDNQGGDFEHSLTAETTSTSDRTGGYVRSSPAAYSAHGAHDLPHSLQAARSRSILVGTPPTQNPDHSTHFETEDVVDFIASYQKILDGEESHTKALENNEAEQEVVAQEIHERQARWATLREEGKKVKAMRKQDIRDKKRLRQSLSEKERALLEYGMELEKRDSKCAKMSEESPSDGEMAEE